MSESEKGDLYLVVGLSTQHPLGKQFAPGKEGVVFREARRNTNFEFFLPVLESTTSCVLRGSVTLNTRFASDGFCPIVVAEPVPKVIGLFVLRNFDRKTVAEAVRKRFGQGSVLMKAPYCSTCNRAMLYGMGHFYHCPTCGNARCGHSFGTLRDSLLGAVVNASPPQVQLLGAC